jgi:hypothetical protein
VTKRTPTGTDPAPPVFKAICGHLDRKGDVQRVCVRDPHDDAQHNMVAATPELARSLAAKGIGGPGIDQLGMVHPGEYFDVPDPEAADRESTLVTGNPDVRPAVPPPDGGPATADPAPTTPSVSGDPLEPSPATGAAAGSGGGPGRPSLCSQCGQPWEARACGPTHAAIKAEAAAGVPPAVIKAPDGNFGNPTSAARNELEWPATGRSIGTVIAHTATDAALGVPVDVQDERAHAREATEILLVATAEHLSHNRPIPAERLLDLEAIVQHMVGARGLRGGS